MNTTPSQKFQGDLCPVISNNEDLPGVTGTITFTQTKSGVLVEANVTGLKPTASTASTSTSGAISLHPTEPGPAGTTTPGAEHGLPSVHDHDGEAHAMTGGHAGDLGNLESDSDGNAIYSKTYEDLSLTSDKAILGRAIIVHLNEDDGGQPTGNAGPRVAQGVIGIANPE